MTIKKFSKLFLYAASAAVFSISGSADAGFVNSGTPYKSSVLGRNVRANNAPQHLDNEGNDLSTYKRCEFSPLKADEADIADDYDKAMSEDPLEGYNRVVHKVNHTLDRYILRPVAKGYRAVVPQWGRERVSNAFSNLDEPRNFANSILQFDGKGAFTSFWRFAINTTIGIGGTHDVAGGFGLQGVDKDFSTTLAHYGVETGPYFEIPLLGPSTIRDAGGKIPDAFTYPPNYLEETWASVGINVVDAVQSREAILDYTDDLEKDSLDLYSSYKSSYLQNRKKTVAKALDPRR